MLSAEGHDTARVAKDRHRVLLVDDEPELRQMVRRYLEAEAFEVHEARDASTALTLLRDSRPDLVLLDVAMPGVDGFEVLQKIRRRSNVPVIMLTARTEEFDRVLGLTIGADDYVTKPFSPRELVARIRAVLRRGRADTPEPDKALNFDGIAINVSTRTVTTDGEQRDLSALEFDLLAALAAAPGRVFTRAQLLERVWGGDYFGAERVIDVHIGNLRKSLGDSAGAPRFVGTVRGVGYRFVAVPR